MEAGGGVGRRRVKWVGRWWFGRVPACPPHPAAPSRQRASFSCSRVVAPMMVEATYLHRGRRRGTVCCDGMLACLRRSRPALPPCHAPRAQRRRTTATCTTPAPAAPGSGPWPARARGTWRPPHASAPSGTWAGNQGTVAWRAGQGGRAGCQGFVRLCETAEAMGQQGAGISSSSRRAAARGSRRPARGAADGSSKWGSRGRQPAGAP